MVNRRAMEALIRAGAFDAIEPNRASLLASLGAAIEGADHAEQFASQTSLFGGAGGATEAFELTRAPMWAERERLQNEKQSLGFYLSGHPFNAYRDELRRFARTPLANLAPQMEPVMLAGVIYGVQMRNSRRGRMAILTLDDGSARVEVVVFGELFHEKRAVVQEDQVVVVKGRIFPDEFSGGLRITADQLMDLAEVRAAHARLLRLCINGQADSAKLKSLLAQYAGGQCHVAIRYRNAQGECDIRLPESCRVKVSGPLLDSLAEWLDEKNVEVVYWKSGSVPTYDLLILGAATRRCAPPSPRAARPRGARRRIGADPFPRRQQPPHAQHAHHARRSARCAHRRLSRRGVLAGSAQGHRRAHRREARAHGDPQTERHLPWMKQHGVRFQAPLGGTLHLARTNAFFLGGGKALDERLLRRGRRRSASRSRMTAKWSTLVARRPLHSATVRSKGASTRSARAWSRPRADSSRTSRGCAKRGGRPPTTSSCAARRTTWAAC